MSTPIQIQPDVSFGEALRVWTRIGFISFGGPAGQIALMHRILVEEKRWIDERRYLTALNFCMLLPGPEAMQLATYVGWRLHGVKGGLAAGLLFFLPGAAIMLALAMGYAAFGKVPIAEAIFLGVKAAVLAIVVEALVRVSRRALRGRVDWIIAAAAFLAIYALGVPFPLIVLGAALFGLLRATQPGQAAVFDGPMPVTVTPGATLRTVLLWLAMWIAPLAAMVAMLGSDHVLSQLAWFFSKLAVVTFGGAYAVLAYMAQEVVQGYRWLEAGEMLDALGLAETTPGPLILVNEFVGALAAWRYGGGPGWVMAILGAFVTLWATFAPCFLWIFAGAPYVERLHAEPRLKSALSAVTAAVVGVILNLTVWFALHVLFGQVETPGWAGGYAHVPVLSSLSCEAAVLSAVAFAALFGFHRGILTTLALTSTLSLLWRFSTGALV